MSAERGGRRDARRASERRRRRWFGPMVVAFVAVALTAVLRSPHAGLDLADDDASTTSVASPPATEVGVAPPLPPPDTAAPVVGGDTLVPAEAATTVGRGPATSSPEADAASDLESMFVALEGRDFVGAFDRYTPALQQAVGGFDAFAGLWKAASAIEHDDASCIADGDGFACTIRFRAYAADGACAEATYRYRVTWTGRRHDIAAEEPVSVTTCARRPAVSTTTTTS